MRSPDYDRDTLVIHGDGDEGLADVAPPIHASSTYRARSADEFERIAGETRPERYYTRYGNPTVARAERILAGLEGTEAALLFASGMGAISTTVLAHLRAGDHVVAQRCHYMGTAKLVGELLPRFGVAATLVDQGDAGAFARALRPNTRLILVETPSNPLLAITDLAAIGALGRDRGIVTVADNTFASPIQQRPAEFGIDLVVHSATKYLGGHSDLVAGALCGSRERVAQAWEQAIVLGACSNGFEAFLLLRGLRTLPLRVRRQSETAMRIASFLQDHPDVAVVNYPGLASHPQHALAARQMSAFGGLMSFELKGDADAARRFVAALQLAANAVSLGGVETLAVPVGAMWEGTLGGEAEAPAMAGGLVRLAVGLEHPDDLLRDLAQALEQAGGRR